MLLAEDIYSTPGLLPAIGRLANAMVAVLGPEYSLGSAAYIACKSIINDMRPGEAGVHVGLEAALKKQRLFFCNAQKILPVRT